MANQRDQFGYQLKNIQALPQGLMKTSSLNNNNKLYPFLEHYTSTAEEKHALENKITYNGMRKIILANKEFNKNKRIIILNEIDVELKMLKVMIRVSYRKKYINSKNYSAWSKKIYNIGNLLGGWIKSCLKV